MKEHVWTFLLEKYLILAAFEGKKCLNQIELPRSDHCYFEQGKTKKPYKFEI